jgi:pimeloyl-ACP methyl ester carboxylesterase
MAKSISTVQGGTRLVFDATEAITNTVEQMHETIARRPLPWAGQPDAPTRAHGLIAASVYTAIRSINGLLREGTDSVFDLLAAGDPGRGQSDGEIRTVAALNGAFGDHLEASGNALATPMSLIYSGQALTINPEELASSIPQASPHLVVLVHGLSLSELSWSRSGGPSIGTLLQQEQGLTPVYLRYNTGRHISTNGRAFNTLLQQLCDAWPVPVESLSVIGHSMGGLVTRSACWYAQQEGTSWLQRLQRVVCLGTPHHGSPVEKAGHAFDIAMRKIPYLAPLALGRHRSDGIKDLHHGDLLDEDWQGHDPARRRQDKRAAVPLLPTVDYYFAAATVGESTAAPLSILLGDLLVRLDSAMGSHNDESRKLPIDPQNCRAFPASNHFDLLDAPEVQRQIADWFSESSGTRPVLPPAANSL